MKNSTLESLIFASKRQTFRPSSYMYFSFHGPSTYGYISGRKVELPSTWLYSLKSHFVEQQATATACKSRRSVSDHDDDDNDANEDDSWTTARPKKVASLHFKMTSGSTQSKTWQKWTRPFCCRILVQIQSRNQKFSIHTKKTKKAIYHFSNKLSTDGNGRNMVQLMLSAIITFLLFCALGGAQYRYHFGDAIKANEQPCISMRMVVSVVTLKKFCFCETTSSEEHQIQASVVNFLFDQIDKQVVLSA